MITDSKWRMIHTRFLAFVERLVVENGWIETSRRKITRFRRKITWFWLKFLDFDQKWLEPKNYGMEEFRKRKTLIYKNDKWVQKLHDCIKSMTKNAILILTMILVINQYLIKGKCVHFTWLENTITMFKYFVKIL